MPASTSSPRTWFITGVSSGLGEALAGAVMAAGDFVFGTFRRPEQAEAFGPAVLRGGGKGLLLDVTDLAGIERAVRQAIESKGTIDVLVNNAGLGFVGAVEETAQREFQDVFAVNFFGPLALTRAVLPHMRGAGGGHIVQISSHGGIKAFAGFGAYNASKFALEGMSEALAQEVAPLGIRTTIVEPGPFRTRFAGDGLREAEQRLADYEATAGSFRDRLRGVHGRQEGDPTKAAAAIIRAVNDPASPLRLPLGTTALRTIEKKLEEVRADVEASREVATGAVYLK